MRIFDTCHKNYHLIFFFLQFVWGEGDDGKQIDNVELPNWAKSPEHFIQLHREVCDIIRVF